ncbi:MAG: chalcone isomerase family protein [Limnohabitans sp.]
MWCSTRSRAERALAIGLVLAGLHAAAPASQGVAGSPAGPSAAAGAATHPQLPGSRLQGQATLRYWGMRVYQARLWTQPDFRADKAAEQPLALELRYLLDLGGSAIAERSLQEMRRAGPISAERAERWLAAMQRLFPDIKSGERLTGVLQPGQGVSFWHNDRQIGQIADAEFARLFFGIWLAPTTSEPDMRLALLGLQDPSGKR